MNFQLDENILNLELGTGSLTELASATFEFESEFHLLNSGYQD